MSENTPIEWAHHSFNLWWGCTEVSPGCDNCYARVLAHRLHPKLKLWGKDSGRLSILGSDGKRRTMNMPYRWNNRAAKRGERYRIFVQSMGDVFDNIGKRSLDDERAYLWTMIRKTPNLDWLLLTKRISNAPTMLPPDLCRAPNVWLGISVVNQEEADRDIPKLLAMPARLRFLSCEPLLGPIDLPECTGDDRCKLSAVDGHSDHPLGGIDWVIVGGESGSKARPMHPQWARALRDQCSDARVPFLFKQWGEWAPNCLCGPKPRCAETPRPGLWHPGVMFRCGKKAAGRVLDGRTWDEFPEAHTPDLCQICGGETPCHCNNPEGPL